MTNGVSLVKAGRQAGRQANSIIKYKNNFTCISKVYFALF